MELAGEESVKRSEYSEAALMFTDIEGSTNLLQELGDAYGEVLVRHHDIVRDVLAEFDGAEDNTQGDSFFAYFESVPKALSAAIRIQRDLASEPWPRGIQLRVRIGLHFGEMKMLGDTGVGLDIHRAARICSAAHGGQIVLSKSARRSLLTDDFLRWNVELRPLGRHRLKDIRYPETLYDIVDPSSPVEFPPLRSVDSRHTNISTSRGPIIGRDREVDEVLRLLDEHPGRLVTITGTGGTGKTTLSERVAELCLDRYPDGVYVVDLGAVTDDALVFPTIAQALRIRDYPGRPVILDIAATIGAERQLLVLDTFEHVIDTALGLGDLLADCPNLRILVTSRSELGLSMESVYPLGPLALPSPDDLDPPITGALKLFVDRMREVSPEMELDRENLRAAAEITRRLEGLPLALELAAARLVLLTPRQLLGRLDEKLKFLRSSKRDVSRHRTLRAAIEWSENLLDDFERDTFQRLAVFSGGFKIDDAEAIVLTDADGGDVLDAIGSLVSKSLLYRRLVNGEPKFQMYDVVREYATDALAKKSLLEPLRRAHSAYFTEVAEYCGAMVQHRTQRRFVVRLVEESDNIRAALRHSLDTGDISTVARLINALHWYWISLGQFTEALSWIEQAVGLCRQFSKTDEAGDIHLAAAFVKATAGDYVGAYPHGRDAERIFTETGNEHRAKQAALIHALCAAAAEKVEDPSEILFGCVAYAREKNDDFFLALGLIILGEGARMQGEKEAAEECYTEAIEIFDRIGNTFWPGLLRQNIGHFRLSQGKTDEAAALFSEAFDLGDEFDYPTVVGLCVAGFGGVALARGDAEKAARLLGGTETHMEKIGAAFEPTDKADIDGYVAGAQKALGNEKYETSRREGAEAEWADLKQEARQLGELPN